MTWQLAARQDGIFHINTASDGAGGLYATSWSLTGGASGDLAQHVNSAGMALWRRVAVAR